jgi:hypothetical protein
VLDPPTVEAWPHIVNTQFRTCDIEETLVKPFFSFYFSELLFFCYYEFYNVLFIDF